MVCCLFFPVGAHTYIYRVGACSISTWRQRLGNPGLSNKGHVYPTPSWDRGMAYMSAMYCFLCIQFLSVHLCACRETNVFLFYFFLYFFSSCALCLIHFLMFLSTKWFWTMASTTILSCPSWVSFLFLLSLSIFVCKLCAQWLFCWETILSFLLSSRSLFSWEHYIILSKMVLLKLWC